MSENTTSGPNVHTVPGLMEKRVKDHGTRLLFQRRDGWSWKQITWLDFDREVKNIASFLMDLGFGKGDRALVVSANTLEAISTEIAVYHLGGTVVSLSRDADVSIIKRLAKELQAKFIFIENPDLLEGAASVLEESPSILRASFFNDVKTKNEKILNFRSILKFGLMKKKKLQDELKELSEGLEPQIPAAIFIKQNEDAYEKYEYTQGDILSALERICGDILGIGDEDQSFSYIPSASPYSRIINYLTLYNITRAATAESRDDYYQDMPEVMPTIIYETAEGLEGIYTKSVSKLDGLSPEKKLKRDLGGRVKHIFTDKIPGSGIESAYKSAGVTFNLVPELGDKFTERA